MVFRGLATWQSIKYVREFPDRMKSWLYADNWSKEKLHKYEALSNVPVIGSYMDYLLDVRADEEYLNRYKMDYSDIHNPQKLRQTHSGARVIGEVSRSVMRLYR